MSNKTVVQGNGKASGTNACQIEDPGSYHFVGPKVPNGQTLSSGEDRVCLFAGAANQRRSGVL
jgi:hypothetical protein